MATKSDYVPQNARQFSVFARTMLEYINQHKTAWGHIPQSATAAVWSLFDVFEDALDATAGQHTPAQTLARNIAQRNTAKAIRALVNQYLRFAPVTDVDRSEMGVPNRDVVPTTVPPPTIPVSGALSFPAVGLIEMRKIGAAGEKRDERSKHGVRIYYGIMGVPSETNRFRLSVRPKTGDDLPHSVFTRRRTHRFDFTGESGKEVFFCMRFENSKGQAGPWGKIISAFVP